MKPNSIREKGKRGERCACERVERAGLGKSCRTPGSGNGKKKGDIFNNLPFMIEVKNHSSLHIQEWVRQAKDQAEKGNYDSNKWALVVVNPDGVQDTERMELWFMCEFDEALELMKKNQEPKVKEPDRKLKYLLSKLRELLRRLEGDPMNKYELASARKLSREIEKELC